MGPKSSTDGGTSHMIEGIIPGNCIQFYTNYSISEKSPLWKVFSPHIPVHYRIYFRRPHNPHPKFWGRDPRNPRIDTYVHCSGNIWACLTVNSIFQLISVFPGNGLLGTDQCCTPRSGCQECAR